MRASTWPPPATPMPPVSGAPPASPTPPPSEPRGTRYVPTEPPPAKARTQPPRRRADTEPAAERKPAEVPADPSTSVWERGESPPPPSEPGQPDRGSGPGRLPRRHRVTVPRRKSHTLEELPFEVDEPPRELPSIAEPLSPIDWRRRRPQLPSDPPPDPQPVASLRRTPTAPQMARVTPTPAEPDSRSVITEPAMAQFSDVLNGGRTIPETPPFMEVGPPSDPQAAIVLDGDHHPVGGDVGPGWMPLDQGYAEELTPTPSDTIGRVGGMSPDAWVDRADPGLDALPRTAAASVDALWWLLVEDVVR